MRMLKRRLLAVSEQAQLPRAEEADQAHAGGCRMHERLLWRRHGMI